MKLGQRLNGGATQERLCIPDGLCVRHSVVNPAIRDVRFCILCPLRFFQLSSVSYSYYTRRASVTSHARCTNA